MPKRYEFRFETSKGTVTLGTDDINDESIGQFFREFLGLEQAGAQSVDSTKLSVAKQEVAYLKEELKELREELKKSREREPLPEIQEKSSQAIPARPAGPQQQPGPQGIPQADFMSVPPNQMKEDLWNSLSQEDKSKWMDFYGIK